MNHYIVLKQPKRISLEIFIYELHNRRGKMGEGERWCDPTRLGSVNNIRNEISWKNFVTLKSRDVNFSLDLKTFP